MNHEVWQMGGRAQRSAVLIDVGGYVHCMGHEELHV